ncbi:MAG: LPS-assembly protein LptD, partial [Nitrospirota bacterium]|nr:LPS-assembly protein LptD [Nitrospirota bacterium]
GVGEGRAQPAQPAASKQAVSAQTVQTQPIHVSADQLTYQQDRETYEAIGSVLIVQGMMRLTADRVHINMLSGKLTAMGHAHLTDPTSELKAEQLEINVNTDAGVVVNGTLYMKGSNTLVTGRLLQRFSEDHYRAKEGSFTNCDAKQGETPAWRFTFKDMDLKAGDSFYGKDIWFCVNDVPLVPLPTVAYPVQTARKSGALVPELGYDNRFGAHYRQSFFWAMSPSQDLLVTPDYLSQRGSGGDLQYRYILNRQSRGQWLLSFIQDNVTNTTRAQAIGTHSQQFNDDLSLHIKSNLLSDRTILNNLSNSGTLRAAPSQESNFTLNQRYALGNMYLLGQFLQPVGAGSTNTFQRLPEIGFNLFNAAPLGGPALLGMENTFVNFYRDQGFQLNRVDLMPTLSTDAINVGHVVGITPQLKLREVYYTRGVTTDKMVHRETLWASLDATSRLSRNFSKGDGTSLIHTIEPDIIYEYVPPSDQSQIVQIDAVDDLPKKNLLTYSLKSRLLEMGPDGHNSNWLDLMLAQSYHVGSPQSQARFFPFPDNLLFASTIQPLQPTMVAVQGKKFSDLWARAVIGNNVGTPAIMNPMSLTMDAFFDPYSRSLSQWNTDVRYQNRDQWYVELGQRYTNDGNRVRRGDLWNPISFNEVYAPTQAVHYATGTIAARMPYGWTLGAQTYYDMKSGQRPETDIVGVYQNPCKCWSLGLFYIQFPDRVQYNFLISLTGIGATEGYGTQLMRAILNPLLKDERGVPWPTSPTLRSSSSSQGMMQPGQPGMGR